MRRRRFGPTRRVVGTAPRAASPCGEKPGGCGPCLPPTNCGWSGCPCGEPDERPARFLGGRTSLRQGGHWGPLTELASAQRNWGPLYQPPPGGAQGATLAGIAVPIAAMFGIWWLVKQV